MAGTACWGSPGAGAQDDNALSHIQVSGSIHGQWGGKQISFGVLILCASKVMNY